MNTENNSEIVYQRKFEKMQDFNLIYLHNFEKLNIPGIIAGKFLKKYPEKVSVSKLLFWKKLIDNPELPDEVTESLKWNNIVSHNGIVYKKESDSSDEVYYDSFADETETVREILNLPDIANSVESLANATRKPVLSRDLLSLPGFKLIEDEKLGDIALSIKDDIALERNMRTCKIVLTIIKDSLLISIDLGILNYSVYRTR